MWFTRLAISRPIVIWVALAAIAVLGVLAYFRLPAELNPKVDIPTVVVTDIYPGAAPAEIETQITRPLEDAIGTVPSVKSVYSSSQANTSIISLDFKPGVDLTAAVEEVRSRIDIARLQLPADARPPTVAKLDINALPILYFGIESRSTGNAALRSVADKIIRPSLERVDGVAKCEIIGGEKREVHVSVSSESLAKFHLTIEDVINSLKTAGRDMPAGSIVRSDTEVTVRLAGAFNNLGAIRSTQIIASTEAQTAALGGNAASAAPITVGDVADVSDSTAEKTAIDRIDGHEGLGIIITRAPDANTVSVVDGVNAAFRNLGPELPQDLHRVVLRDDAVTVRDALQDVDASLIMGAVLAMTVILLFLHNVRGTLIVSLAIPACMIATFLTMYVVHFTLNQMTLLALSLSVGILVDDSIVVLESITRHLAAGEAPIDAAINGRAEIGFADLTTTLADVVVFLPIAFMGGVVGSFFKQFGLVIAVSTLFSLVVSFSVTPMLAARWYGARDGAAASHGLFGILERRYRRLESVYRAALTWALHHRAVVVLCGTASLALIFLLSFYRLGADFIPGTDQGQIAVNIELAPGASLDATGVVVRDAEQTIAAEPDVAATVSSAGQIVGGFGSIPKEGMQFGQITVRLREKGGLLERIFAAGKRVRTRSDEDIAALFRKKLSDVAARHQADITTSAIRSVSAGASPVEILIRGSDPAGLIAFAGVIKTNLAHVPGVLAPSMSFREGKPEIRATIDRSRASEHSISPAIAGAVLHDSIAGNTDAELTADSTTVPIRVRLAAGERQHLNDVGNLIVGTDVSGSPVLLSDVAGIKMATGPADIERLDGKRLITVSSNLAGDTALSSVQQAMNRVIRDTPHPGIEVTWGGDAERISDSAVPFATALILGIVLVYLLMAALFNSVGTPFVIMFTLPMALIGALGALVITGERMSLVSAIGIIMLIGLMGRNAILLIDFTNTLRGRGKQRNEAIVDAGAARLRPILMTTCATIAGMLPVALRFGRASEIRAPMAIVVIGGLTVSTVLTLIVIPVLYSLFDDVKSRRSHKSAI